MLRRLALFNIRICCFPDIAFAKISCWMQSSATHKVVIFAERALENRRRWSTTSGALYDTQPYVVPGRTLLTMCTGSVAQRQTRQLS